MKKQMAIAMAVACGGVLAALTGVELKKGANGAPGPCRAVAAQAVSTNASGTVALKRVTPLVVEWYDESTVTNYTYRPAMSNVTYTVTETLWKAWSTNALAGGGVASNLLAEAWGGRPTVAGWPTNVLLYTSSLESRTLSSNVTYQVVDTVDVRIARTRRTAEKAVTNTLWNATLTNGYKTNVLDAAIFKGDILLGEGTAFDGGKVQLILER